MATAAAPMRSGLYPALQSDDQPGQSTLSSGRVAAGFLLERQVGRQRYWLLLHSTKWREWGFPKGHRESGESLYATALRECAEECGIALVAPLGPAYQAAYQLGSGKHKVVYYFPARTNQTAVTLSSEHDCAEWCTADQVLTRLNHAQLVDLFQAHLKGHAWPSP